MLLVGAGLRILVVDDDPDIRRIVTRTFELEGFDARSAAGADEALSEIRRRGLPHLAIVDLRMPGKSGEELCQEIRNFSDVPLVVLTAVDDKRKVVDMLRGAADDYVIKPFRPDELVARVRGILSRMPELSHTDGAEWLIDDQLRIDLPNQRATVRGEQRKLTPIETKLLHLLLRVGGRVCRSEFLIRRIWPDGGVFEDTLRVHVHRLRAKLEADPSDPRYVLTERGAGYRFATSDAGAPASAGPRRPSA